MAFQRAHDSHHDEDIWTELTANNNGFTDALRSKDFGHLRNDFTNLFHGPLLFGMGHTDIFLTERSPYNPQYFSLRCRDSILALSEALGLKPLTSNQQTSFDDYLKATNGDLEEFVEKIEKYLGFSVTAPAVGRPPVAEIGRFRVSPDSVRHAYVMHRVKELGFKPSSSILEIGGGFGNVARYAYLEGFRNYTIVDIPYVTAIQAAFLSATVGASNVAVFGEEIDAALTIHPSTQKELLSKPLDLAINMDSLPEINTDEALDYLALVRSKAKFFLSINQEAQKTHRGKIKQNSVPELIEIAGGFKRLHRHPYWMEQGYAEELYEVTGNV